MEKKDSKKKTQDTEIKDKVKVDLEPELTYILEELEAELEQLGEALSVSARIKKRQVMRRYRSRIKLARKRMSRRRATQARITKRARRSAVTQVKRRYAGGKSLSKLSYAERARVERMAARRKSLVNRTTRRMIRVKRQQEKQRLSRR